jgi:hypothetical protein
MTLPLVIDIRGAAPPQELRTFIHGCAEHLGRAHPEATHCAVALDLLPGQSHNGQHYSVRVDVSTPTGAVAVARDPAHDGSLESVRLLVGEAFEAATRELDGDIREQRARRATP